MSRVEIQRMHRIGSLLSNYVVWWTFFTLIFATVAASLGSDGTPDFKIYHFYNGFAAHHDRSSLDIIPAQKQTAFFNKVDAVYYSLFTALNHWPRLLNVLLSVPYSAAAFAVYAIGRLCLARSFYWRNLACAAAAIFGLTGASALPTLATTMTDIVPGTPFLFALLVWLALEKHDRNTAWTAFIVGLIAGFSIGLKLTLAPLFVGLLLAITVRSVLGRRSAVWEAFRFRGSWRRRFHRNRYFLALGQLPDLWKPNLSSHERRVQIGPGRPMAVDRSSFHAEDRADGVVLSRILGIPAFP
jgi:hypothetical protein